MDSNHHAPVFTTRARTMHIPAFTDLATLPMLKYLGLLNILSSHKFPQAAYNLGIEKDYLY